jgi:hypothetical protein
MKTNLRMRLYSLGEGGCPVGVLPGKALYISKERELGGFVGSGFFGIATYWSRHA